MRYRLRKLLIVVTIVAALLAGSRLFQTVEGRGVTAKEANRKLWACQVPPDASDVWFRTNWRETMVECKLDKTTFINWAKSNDWHLQLIEPSVAYPVSPRLQLQGELYANVSVKNGFEVEQRTLKLKASVHGAFDAAESRAYIIDEGNH